MSAVGGEEAVMGVMGDSDLKFKRRLAMPLVRRRPVGGLGGRGTTYIRESPKISFKGNLKEGVARPWRVSGDEFAK